MSLGVSLVRSEGAGGGGGGEEREEEEERANSFCQKRERGAMANEEEKAAIDSLFSIGKASRAPSASSAFPLPSRSRSRTRRALRSGPTFFANRERTE